MTGVFLATSLSPGRLLAGLATAALLVSVLVACTPDEAPDALALQLKYIDLQGQIQQRPYDVEAYEALPDFVSISDIPTRKQAFFDYMTPPIAFQNEVLRERRLVLAAIQASAEAGVELSATQNDFMALMRKRYRIPEEATDAEALLMLDRRIDAIPPSMVLSQAAMESAWGTSRFATKANNLFGQWCYREGCGLVPKSRPSEARHEVAKYDRVDLAVQSYFRNINTHPTYAELREIRQQAREQGREPTGIEMVGGLGNYSARGDDYIEELRDMISYNGLE